MLGQVFTVAKLHYINGVVYFAAREKNVDVKTLADHYAETTKSGDVMHPAVRVRTLARLAEGVGLLNRVGKTQFTITELGRNYYESRSDEVWSLSESQKALLREYIISNPSKTPTIHSIVSLLSLVHEGYSGKELSHQYAKAIGKEAAWKSDVTYEGFTKFGLDYLQELGLLDQDVDLVHVSHSPKREKQGANNKRTFLFTWNPKRWHWDDLPQAVYEANVEGQYLDKWSCGVTKNISVGDRAFLIRLGEPPKGMIGSGTIVSEPYESAHWNAEKAEQGVTVYRVNILFDVLSEIPILDEQVLSSGGLADHNWYPRASGTIIPENIAKQLEVIWSRATATSYESPQADEIPTLHNEGKKNSRHVTTYERNREAREACLRFHGTICQVCGLKYELRYGEIGRGFIHVHHIVPVSEIGKEHKVDPIKDLLPVCPNCHAMLHMRTPPLSVEQLKEMMDTFS